MRKLLSMLPEDLRIALLFRLGLAQIPMMRYVRPRLVELTRERVVVAVRLRRRTKNMYGSMYLGALHVGADCVTGFYPAKFMLETGHRVPPIIKTSSATFLRRVNGEALFTCDQGREITQLCERAVASGERLQCDLRIVATAPDEFGDEPAAVFDQVLSLRNLGAR